MANRTLPLLLLNLGGEMVYILEQRLRAQKVSPEKATKVMMDICHLLLHERFIAELMVPQPLGHVTALRAFFRDLAHASIMRLDDESMGKMWDLMTMAVKQQALRADSPGELLQATLNHMDYIADHVPAVQLQAELARQALVTFYSRMPSGELQSIRYTVLNYLQGLAVRVSLYLKQGLQDMNGRIVLPREGPVPPGCEPPGVLRVMDGGGREVDSVLHVIHFPPGGQFTSARDPAGLGTGTTLGCNMYTEHEEAGATVTASRRRQDGAGDAEAADTPAVVRDAHGRPLYVGREELNMLMAQLLGNRPSPRDVPNRLISVSLFSSAAGSGSGSAAGDAEPLPETSRKAAGAGRDGGAGGGGDAGVMSIDASGSAGSRSASLQRVLSDLDGQALGQAHGEGYAGDVQGAGSLLDLWDDLEDT